MPTAPEAVALQPWWGRWELAEGEAGHWRVGPLDLWLRRRPQEWRVAYETAEDALASALEVRCPLAAAEVPEVEDVLRFVSGRRARAIEVRPALADRPVVARPELPFYLLGGDDVTIYVSTPLWLRLGEADPPRTLLEVPCHRPSDTWFGASTREGEICYASRTAARLELANLPVRPHRAITRIQLRNRAPGELLLERLSLPVPHLAIFWSASRGLWTQAVEVTRAADGTLAQVQLQDGPAEPAPDWERVGDARVAGDRSLLVRALGALLG